MTEFEIYHTLNLPFIKDSPKQIKRRKKLAKLLAKISIITFIAGFILVVAAFVPSFYYWARGFRAAALSKLLAKTAQQTQVVKPVDNYLPSFDPKLPVEPTLKITSAKIETVIREADNDHYEDALKKGVWRVNDFGTPAVRTKPTILAAHRFGYLAWSIPYRLKNSFYNLPKLKVGDLVEIDWGQRRYVYEVYAEGKGEEITDYSADLILYTCEAMNSSVRIFRYARLLRI